MLESVLERLDAGQPINSVATNATQFKSVFQLILRLFLRLTAVMAFTVSNA